MFLQHWLISGPKCERYVPDKNSPVTWQDQLGFEKAQRAVFFKDLNTAPQAINSIEDKSLMGGNFTYYYNNGNCFVDVSTFYSLLTCVRADAVTNIISADKTTVKAVLWTYAAVDLWLNGERVLKAQPPVYKPILKHEIELNLKKGTNQLYVVMQNLGVRDTRNIFGVEVLDDTVKNTLPDEQNTNSYIEAEQWLQSLKCSGNKLIISEKAPFKATLTTNLSTTCIADESEISLGECEKFAVKIMPKDIELKREFELLCNIKPMQTNGAEDHIKTQFLRIANEESEPRGNGVRFSVYNVMARCELGMQTPQDEKLLLNDLDFIDSRGDCADFLVIGFLRLLSKYRDKITDDTFAKIKQCLLNFRYWMDEPGSDGMCFWSENHALMFYGAQHVAGKMFKDDIFTNSNKRGSEQATIGAKRCLDWLEDVEKEGVEEFNSASYMPVTITALLHLVDFADEQISKKAQSLMDLIAQMLCKHVFKNSVISPQGRVYRDVIYPHRQSVQSVLHIIDSELPFSNKEVFWNIVFATTKYKFKDNLKQLIKNDVSESYISSNARINIEKAKDYMLTSVKSPRSGDDAPKWENLCFKDDVDKSTNAYVKSLNERFHGTSVFEPGVYGYQQHLWYAALDNECIVFVNHPGSFADLDSMRPGYWYGNGVFPALDQNKNELYAIYNNPQDHPVKFTHTFWPASKFDETVKSGNWIFGRKGSGYIALWCSEQQVAQDGVLQQCEYRCNSANAAYVCICGGKVQHNSFEDFCNYCTEKTPQYDDTSKCLTVDKKEVLTFKQHKNITQYI